MKVLLIGDSGVGKTALLHSFTSETFDPDIGVTIGMDIRVKEVSVLDTQTGQAKRMSMKLWDTAGQERFRTVTSSYYRGAHAIVLVYDVNEPETFFSLQNWLDEANSYRCKDTCDEEVVYLLLGNKVDQCPLVDEMPVSSVTAQNFAKKHQMLFALTSAKTRAGVVQAFDEVAQSVYDKMSDALNDDTKNRILSGALPAQSGDAGGCC